MYDPEVNRQVTFAKQDAKDAMRLIDGLQRSEFVRRPDAYLRNIQAYLENATGYIKEARRLAQ